jgi:uncharacterized protein with von Willebrand factor type A (vWA) domain
LWVNVEPMPWTRSVGVVDMAAAYAERRLLDLVPTSARGAMPMLDAIEGLVRELRAIGIPVSMTEHLDAVSATTLTDLGRRDELREALGATLVKTEEHRKAFDVVFGLYFSLAAKSSDTDAGHEGDEAGSEGSADSRSVAADSRGVPPGASAGGGGLSSIDDDGLRELLLSALGTDDAMTMARISSEMVDRHAGVDPGRAVAGTFYLMRTMRSLGPDTLLTRLMETESTAAGPTGALDRRLALEKNERRLERLRHEVESQIRRRLVADRGAAAVARTLREPLPEDLDFLQASQQQITALREIMQPLARKLSAQLEVKRRRRRTGPLDFRRTVSRAMSTGGVPSEPIFRPSRPAKPHLMVIADISGSVASFAAFTLQLTYALRTEFAAVRCFVFVDGVDEVTHVLAESGDIATATHRINQEGRGLWLDGRSDYGHALESFWERCGAQIRSRTTVIVLGDARNNYHAPRAELLGLISKRAQAVYWLNPEPVTAWNTGDSVIGAYAPYCEAVLECRNVRQVKAFVERLG